jgi:signal transduction histidine kinase
MSSACSKLPEDCARGEVASFRQSMAEKLHDGPLQELLALQLKAVNLARLSQLGPDDLRYRLVEIGALAQSAVDHLQGIVRDLAELPPMPENLAERVRALCQHFRTGSGIECELAVPAAHMTFPAHVSDVLYRTLRELLTNVRKHSHATKVRIVSSRRPDGVVTVSVEDNGIGMFAHRRPRNPFEAGGFGLWSIEQRLAEFGAALEIESDSGGVRATVILPAS